MDIEVMEIKLEAIGEVAMIKVDSSLGKRLTLAAVLISAGLLIFATGVTHSHGGKTHAEEPFSAFQAVQKATRLYDRLIVSGKLPEGWETDLSTIHVSIRKTENSRDYVVQFKRSSGNPDSVFFFFDRQGEYAGSNDTGK